MHHLGDLEGWIPQAIASSSGTGGEGQIIYGLSEGSMTVMEYATKFIQLSRFAVYLIPYEEKKAKKFEKGLKSRVKTMITCFDIRNFS